MSRDPDEIRASSILPARRTEVVLHTADDLRLVGELALPGGARPGRHARHAPPAADARVGSWTATCSRKRRYRLPALADVAVLRFNACVEGEFATRPRPTGRSTTADSERFDVAAAIEYAEFHEAPELRNRWLVGWSFGTDLALMYGNDPVDRRGPSCSARRCATSSPEHLAAWADSGKPLLALVPELDDYLRPAEARERFGASAAGRGGRRGDGAKHLWVGEPYVRRVHEEIVRRVNPAALPLTTTWPAADQQHEPSPATRLG